MTKRHQKDKDIQHQTLSAVDAAKKVKALERSKIAYPSAGSTQHRTYTEASKFIKNIISDEMTSEDPNITLPFYEKYQDEKLKNIAFEIESRSTERIHEIKGYITTKISDNKTEMLRWMIGIVVVILLGLIGFHFKSLSIISENLEVKFKQNFADIKDRIINLENSSSARDHKIIDKSSHEKEKADKRF